MYKTLYNFLEMILYLLLEMFLFYTSPGKLAASEHPQCCISMQTVFTSVIFDEL